LKDTEKNQKSQELQQLNGESEMPAVSMPEEESIINITQQIEQVEQNIQFFKKVRTLSLSLTNHKDWLFQDDSLYLMDSGAEKIAIAWGIHIKSETPKLEWHEDKKGRYYQFVAHGQALSRKLNRYVEDIGTCSQRDKFFGTVNGKLLPIEDVDMNMIRKKAVTNLYNRLIKRLAGLVNITEDELKAAGIEISKIAKVKFRTGKRKEERKLSEEALKKRNKLWDICLELTAGNEAEASAKLVKFSSFTVGKKTFKAEKLEDLKSDKWIDATYGRAVKEYENYFGKAFEGSGMGQ